MYELFKAREGSGSANYALPKALQARSLVNREISRIAGHYRKIESEVPRTHLLVKLIELLNISVHRDEYSIESACGDNLKNICPLLGLIHPYNPKPQSHNGVFYNTGLSEYIVARDFNDVSHEWLRKNWQLANTIQIMTHPYTDLDYGLCNGDYPHNNPGYAVFFINVPALLIQYKYWCLDRASHGIRLFKPGIFISQLVIPNMLANHMDICIINRLFAQYDGKQLPKMRRYHNVQLSDHAGLIDELGKSMCQHWNTGEPVEPLHFYRLFPSIMKDHLVDSFKVPDITPNVNVRWAMELSIIKYIDFMVRYYYKQKSPKLRQISGKIKRDVITLETTKEVYNHMTSAMDHLRSIKMHLNENM